METPEIVVTLKKDVKEDQVLFSSNTSKFISFRRLKSELELIFDGPLKGIITTKTGIKAVFDE